MRGSVGGVLALVVVVSLPLLVLSQTGGVQSASHESTPQKPQPQHYTAEFKDRTIKKLSNGTKITRETITVMAEDSQGRSMNSITQSWELVNGKPTTNYSVSDPVARFNINWTSIGTKATVTKYVPPHESGQSGCTLIYTTSGVFDGNTAGDTNSAKPSSGVVARGVASTGGVTMLNKPIFGLYKLSEEEMASNPTSAYMKLLQHNSTSKDLGIKNIKGVVAHGHRYKWITPSGARGNDQPMVHTQETWITTGDNPLALNVREVVKDPESGKSTKILLKLSLDEPDLSVFQPPKGYEIVTQELHTTPCRLPKPPAQ
jgi:hypothetical protein